MFAYYDYITFLQAKTTKVSVERGKQKGTQFEIEFTVPFACSYDNIEYTCTIMIEMDYKSKENGGCETIGALGSGSNLCGATKHGHTIKDYNSHKKWNPSVYWNISNGDDGIFINKNGKYNVNTYKLSLKTTTSESIYDSWNNYEIADIEVSMNNYLENIITLKKIVV